MDSEAAGSGLHRICLRTSRHVPVAAGGAVTAGLAAAWATVDRALRDAGGTEPRLRVRWGAGAAASPDAGDR